MILQRLRDESSRNHSAIESQMPLLDPSMSLSTYRQLLARFLGYYAPLEDRLRTEVEVARPRQYGRKAFLPLVNGSVRGLPLHRLGRDPPA